MRAKLHRVARNSAGAVSLGLVLIAGSASAHDTFIVPPATVTAGKPVSVLLTSSSFFPEPETRIRPERMARVDARIGGQATTWAATADDVATTLSTPPASGSLPAVFVVSLAPFDIEVGADEVSHYMDEIAAEPDVRRAVEAAVARDGVLHETYTKHLKTVVCGVTCADNPASGADTFEFVADPSHAGVFALFLGGEPTPNQTVVLKTEGMGARTLRTDTHGRLHVPDDLTGLVYLSAVKLSPPETPGGRFISQWASLTFDARLLAE